MTGQRLVSQKPTGQKVTGGGDGCDRTRERWALRRFNGETGTRTPSENVALQ